jgi:hypothetical protein
MAFHQRDHRIGHHTRRGLNAAQIAEALDLDPRTVAVWLAEPRFRPRQSSPRASKLDPHKPTIRQGQLRQVRQPARGGEGGDGQGGRMTEPAVFEHIVSVDWSGAATEEKRVDLRVAVYDAASNRSQILDDNARGKPIKNWSRASFRRWLVEWLEHKPPTLVAMDFGFGLPWGADRALFDVAGWRALLREFSRRYAQELTARSTALAIDAQPRFGGHGPFRFNDSRSDFRFGLDHGVAYYRLTELIAPQAISQWYLGSGGTVGFHSITGMAAIDDLIQRREAGELDFTVWPQETLEPNGDRHVLVESYPAIYPMPSDFGPCLEKDADQKDAWRVLVHLAAAQRTGKLGEFFRIKPQPFGRVEGISFEEQIRFEGAIFGLH